MTIHESTLTQDALRIRQLEAQIAAMKLAAQRSIKLKVTDKGGVSIYGLGRFPVTLYASQWERLIQEVPHIEAFLRENADSLARKE